MNKTAVAIYGPPGSGKGTQAELLVKQYGFFHFDTGAYLRRLLNDPKNKHDKEIQREKKLNDEGTLNTPSFVLKRVKKETERISRTGQSIVYSGSPRTLFEAFGDAKNEGLLAVLKKEYGPKNVFIVQLLVNPKTAAKRNAGRLMCSVCGLPILAASKVRTCSFCGAKAMRRVDDNPKLFAHRLDQYEKRTFPILLKAARVGYTIKKVNGEPAPYLIHKKIAALLRLAQ
jgi:adenylate kinase